jgi:hypothetical protein
MTIDELVEKVFPEEFFSQGARGIYKQGLTDVFQMDSAPKDRPILAKTIHGEWLIVKGKGKNFITGWAKIVPPKSFQGWRPLPE